MSAQAKSLAIALAVLSGTAAASGWRAPAYSQLNYSFTCTGGASGHLTYARDTVSRADKQLTLWVNGAYLQNDPKLAPLLSGKSVQSVSASCDGGTTVIFIGTWRANEGKEELVTVHVNQAGQVVSAGV